MAMSAVVALLLLFAVHAAHSLTLPLPSHALAKRSDRASAIAATLRALRPGVLCAAQFAAYADLRAMRAALATAHPPPLAPVAGERYCFSARKP